MKQNHTKWQIQVNTTSGRLDPVWPVVIRDGDLEAKWGTVYSDGYENSSDTCMEGGKSGEVAEGLDMEEDRCEVTARLELNKLACSWSESGAEGCDTGRRLAERARTLHFALDSAVTTKLKPHEDGSPDDRHSSGDEQPRRKCDGHA